MAYRELQTSLQSSSDMLTVSAESGQDGASFTLQISQQGGAESMGDNGMDFLSVSTSRKIAQWLQGLLSILDEIWELVPKDSWLLDKPHGQVAAAAQHIRKWQVHSSSGDTLRRLARYDSNETQTTVNDYQSLEVLVEELSGLSSSTGRAYKSRTIQGLLRFFGKKGMLDGLRRTAIEKALQKTLREFSQIKASMSKSGVSLKLSVASNPFKSETLDSFWTLCCSASSLPESIRDVPAQKLERFRRSEGALDLFGSFDPPIEEVQNDVAWFLSLCERVIKGDKDSRLHSLASEAIDLQPQFASTSAFTDMEASRREYVTSMLSTIETALTHGARVRTLQRTAEAMRNTPK